MQDHHHHHLPQGPAIPFNSSSGGGELFGYNLHNYDPKQQQQQQGRPPRQSPPSNLPRRQRAPSPGTFRRWDDSDGSHDGGVEEHDYEPLDPHHQRQLLSSGRRSRSERHLGRQHLYEAEGGEPRRRSIPPRPDSAPREGYGRPRGGGRSEARASFRKQRSQSLGDRMSQAVCHPSPAPQVDSLFLYHVSRPEPRARWVFNLSKHTNVVDSAPPPDTITSSIDKKRPSLGGLVWINAVLGNLHCCLQKGVKNKAVTPVPAPVLDGWLNGQTGFWWIGALKEGHRALWDSHVVMNWAMVFIPSSPEVAARNNMEVWHDKCLPGSLRVARPGELARKIADIVVDDQDMEPEQVVHTHLCILLAEGDDLELKRPKMFAAVTAPRGGGPQSLKHSNSLGTSTDLSVVKGAGSGDAAGAAGAGAGGAEGDDASGPLGAVATQNIAALEEALEKVGKYRERIILLKEDRKSKKALVEQLRQELEEKEEAYSVENERLRQERNDIEERAKGLWDDLESLRREIDATTAEKDLSLQDAEALKKQVDRLRRERNSARNDAMRWLEQQQQQQQQQWSMPMFMSSSRSLANGNGELGGGGENGDGGDGDGGVDPKTPGRSRGLGARARSAPGMTAGAGGAQEHGEGEHGKKIVVDAKAAEALKKLKSKVERLRRERDDAEKHAAAWLKAEREKLAKDNAAAMAAATAGANGNGHAAMSPADSAAAGVYAPAGGDRGRGGEGNGGGDSSSNGGGASGGGAVVASLRAESLKLKKELEQARAEAEKLRRVSGGGESTGASGGGGGGGGGEGSVRAVIPGPAVPAVTVVNGVSEANVTAAQTGDPEEAGAQLALGRLLGQALNLLGPQGEAEVAAGDDDAVAISSQANDVGERATAAVAASSKIPGLAQEQAAPRPPPAVETTPEEPPTPEVTKPRFGEATAVAGGSSSTGGGGIVGGGGGGGGPTSFESTPMVGLVGERVKQWGKLAAGGGGKVANAVTAVPVYGARSSEERAREGAMPVAELVETAE